MQKKTWLNLTWFFCCFAQKEINELRELLTGEKVMWLVSNYLLIIFKALLWFNMELYHIVSIARKMKLLTNIGKSAFGLRLIQRKCSWRLQVFSALWVVLKNRFRKSFSKTLESLRIFKRSVRIHACQIKRKGMTEYLFSWPNRIWFPSFYNWEFFKRFCVEKCTQSGNCTVS